MGWRFKGNELKYLQEILDSDFKSSASGGMVQRFEKLFSETMGTKYAVGTTSGHAALHQALVACGVGPGDEVIIPALTVVMLGFAVLQAQAHPVFADVRRETFLLDPEDVKRKITPKTKAIIAVHMYGQMCDMEAIMNIARENNLYIIEDCAQCYLARDNRNRISGTIGDIGCFSMSDTKMLSTGEGGVMITNKIKLADRIRKFGGQGFKNLSALSGGIRSNPMIFQDPTYVRHDTFAFNYMMSEVLAAVALAQTERIYELLEKRISMGRLYCSAVENCQWFITQVLPIGYTHSCWAFVAVYEGAEKLGVSWYEFRDKFIEFGGDRVRASWALVYNEPAICNVLVRGSYFSDGFETQAPWAQGTWQDPHCPNSEYLQPRLMHFTTNQNTEEEMMRQADALHKTIDYFGRQ